MILNQKTFRRFTMILIFGVIGVIGVIANTGCQGGRSDKAENDHCVVIQIKDNKTVAANQCKIGFSMIYNKRGSAECDPTAYERWSCRVYIGAEMEHILEDRRSDIHRYDWRYCESESRGKALATESRFGSLECLQVRTSEDA